MEEIIIISGNLTRDPVEYPTKDGDSMVRFTVATSKRIGTTEYTKFYGVACFGLMKEAARAFHLTKGTYVKVTGEPRVNAYISKDGKPKASIDITARTLGAFPKAQQSYSQPSGNFSQFGQARPDEDIPF